MKLLKNLNAVLVLLMLLTAVSYAQNPVEYSAAGIKVLIPDKLIFDIKMDNGTYWEPYTSVFVRWNDSSLRQHVCGGNHNRHDECESRIRESHHWRGKGILGVLHRCRHSVFRQL